MYEDPSTATRPRSLISLYERIQIRRSSDQYLRIIILKARLGLFIPPALPVSRRPLPSTIFNFLTLRSPYNNGDIISKAVQVPVSIVLHVILIYVPFCKRTLLLFLCLSHRAATRHILKTRILPSNIPIAPIRAAWCLFTLTGVPYQVFWRLVLFQRRLLL